ncbi:hypothetical protein ACVRYP_04030 [Streptococcus rifensis]
MENQNKNKEIMRKVLTELARLIVELFRKSWGYLIIVVIVLCAVIIVLEYFSEITSVIIIPGTTDAWLGFWGAIIGTFLSVVFTIFVMLYTMQVDKDSREAEKEPIIVASNTEYKELVMFNRDDDGTSMRNDPKIIENNPYFKLANLGSTGIFDIKGTVTVLNNVGESDGVTIKVENLYVHSYSSDMRNLTFIRKQNLKSFANNSLMPGESVNIEFPPEVTLFSVAGSQNIMKKRPELDFSPELEIEIRYKNYKNKEKYYLFRARIEIEKYHVFWNREKSTREYALNGMTIVEQ